MLQEQNSKSYGQTCIKFGEQVNYGSKKSWLNFRSDLENILDIASLPVGRKLPSVLWHCWLAGSKGIWPVKNGGWWRWAVVSPDGVAPSWMVSVSALLIFPCTIKSRSSFLAPAHRGGPGKGVVKWLYQLVVNPAMHCECLASCMMEPLCISAAVLEQQSILTYFTYISTQLLLLLVITLCWFECGTAERFPVH